jgi:hypothetical protein
VLVVGCHALAPGSTTVVICSIVTASKRLRPCTRPVPGARVCMDPKLDRVPTHGVCHRPSHSEARVDDVAFLDAARNKVTYMAWVRSFTCRRWLVCPINKVKINGKGGSSGRGVAVLRLALKHLDASC